ncbi:MAG: UDP-2,3-diacylglucosamine diphosphatase [Bacteroidaceae bacterium]|nr:UDP-2,3-diacylglucosamine diphosphatase [Bacteroidaceae bacterium]
MKNIYFIADAHLGSRGVPNNRAQEKKLVRFLDSIKEQASALYMLGDMFDFWYEYRMVVPRGFTRFLGKLSELTDRGIEVHYFTGNHDIWCSDYLPQECGVILHREPLLTEILGRRFFLAHGDGLGDPTLSFRLLRAIFHSRLCQVLFSCIHPRWAIDFGLAWAKHSRQKRDKMGGELPYLGEDREYLVRFAKEYLQAHPGEVDFFLFGHRHIELDLTLTAQTRLMIVGDWITQWTYAVFDGENLSLERYEE